MSIKSRKVNFPINGQGVFIYTAREHSNFSIYVTPDKVKDDNDDYTWAPTKEQEETHTHERYIVLRVKENLVQFAICQEKDGKEEELTHKVGKDFGAEVATLVSYWFSYDRDGLVLKYGKGHIMEETTYLEHDFLAGMSEEKKRAIRKKLYPFFNAEKKKTVIVGSEKSEKMFFILDVTPRFQFRPNPLTCNYSPFVLDSSKVTLFDLDRDAHMFSSSLPLACQELYGNIKNVTLEYPENPIMKLSDAIRYSIETKGMTLYKKLKEKSGEFPYLRVTLGPDQRTAPGIPYVLEIWPSGSQSPIHNHGGACAVIKNLFGRITVNIFNKLKDPPPNEDENPIKKFDLKQDQITWISPNWYQTHKLVNNTDDFCATIQCYRYEESDTIHWPGFDFVEGKRHSELEEFFPDSDFTFVHIRGIVLQEYRQFLERIVNPVFNE